LKRSSWTVTELNDQRRVLDRYQLRSGVNLQNLPPCNVPPFRSMLENRSTNSQVPGAAVEYGSRRCNSREITSYCVVRASLPSKHPGCDYVASPKTSDCASAGKRQIGTSIRFRESRVPHETIGMDRGHFSGGPSCLLWGETNIHPLAR
jgi:hypothetical protein